MEKFFVSRPIFATVLAVVIVILGLLSLRTLPVEQYPDITPPMVQVSASYRGADALTVDNSVATPVGQSIMGVSDMLYMESTSANDGTMSMQVTFDIGSDPDMDAIFTQNNISSATPLLPSSVTQQGITVQKSMSGFLLVYSLHSHRYDSRYLSNYAYINLRNELLKVNGVGKVNIMGAGEYAMRVWIEPDLLDYYDITPQEIVAAIEAQSGVYPAGKLGAEPAPAGTQFTYTVTLPAPISTAGEYGNIVVRQQADGSQLRLSDIARVDLGSESYGTSSRYGEEQSAMIVIYQSPGSNAVEVGHEVEAVMRNLARSFPDGVEYTVVVDSTSSIKAGISDIFHTLIIALVLVIAIIYLFLQEWRATLIPLIAIPVSLVGAFMLFPLLGFTVNIISLLGLVLAIGLVVDDAIVVVEAVQVNIEQGMEPRRAAVEAMRSVGPPIVATTVVLLSVFIPVSFIGGITGRLFQQFSVTIAVSVVISAFNALTLSPALCALLLRPHRERTEGFFGGFNRRFSRGVEGYMKFSSVFVRHAVRSVVIVAVVAAAVVGLGRALPSGFLPEEDQGYLMVMVNLPEAASLQRTEAVMAQVDALVAAHPEVESTTYAAGFNMMAGVAATNSGIIFVELVDYSRRKLSAAQLADKLTGELYVAVEGGECYAFTPPSIPGLGVTSGVTFMVQDREGRGIGYLARNARLLIDSLSHSGTFASVTTQFDDNVPQRRLDIDTEYALREGVSLDALHRQIAMFLGGSYINNFNRFGMLYDSYVQAAPEFRTDASDLNLYFVENGRGENVPVSSFVSVVDTVGVEYVTQFNLLRSIAVTATPAAGRSSAQAMATIESVAGRTMPDDIGIAWSGMSYQEKNASSSGVSAYLLAVVFTFLALAALYNSWSLPLGVLLGVPVAIFGALLFLWLAHLFRPMFVDDLFVQISLVMLIGLSAKNAILIVEYADRLFFEQGMSLCEAAAGAAKLRVRPIIMTAFAFVLGVLPLIFANGAYSSARNVMGVALVGGMSVATLLGIFIYPALYVAAGKLGRLERLRNRRREEVAL